MPGGRTNPVKDPHGAYLSLSASHAMESKLRIFDHSPQISHNDYLSNLPEDCLREIYRNLDRVDLRELASASQRTRPLSLSMFHSARKREGAYFEITQFDLGNAFKCIKSDASQRFIYYLRENIEEDDCLFEYKAVEVGENELDEKFEHIFDDYYSSISSPKPPPLLFFARAGQLLQDMSVDSLWIRNTHICATLMDQLQRLMVEQTSNRSIVFQRVKVAETESKCFSEFILSLKPHMIHIVRMDDDHIFFNEQFMEKFASIEDTGLKFETTSDRYLESILQTERFTELLPRFDLLKYKKIRLRDESICEKILERLDRKVEGEWMFQVDRVVGKDEFERTADAYYLTSDEQYTVEGTARDYSVENSSWKAHISFAEDWNRDYAMITFKPI